MTHTPGPWAYDPDSKEVFSTNELHGCGWIALVKGNDSQGCPLPVAEHEANASLIAAAPELLAACKELFMQMRREGCGHQQMLERALAAIAKAEGRGE